MISIDIFVKNWNSKNIMIPISDHDIKVLESTLNIVLPDSFKYLLSKYGLVHSPNVLSKVCDLNVNITEVQDFLNLEDIANLSKLYELSGMPKGHILFASDSKGNMFCFKQTDCLAKKEDAPVWFYNNNECSVTKVSNSFTKWLEQFNDL